MALKRYKSAAILPDERERRFACATCGTSTYHDVIGGVREDGTTEDDIQFSGEYWIIQCRGCKTLSFCHRSSNSEDLEYDEDGNVISAVRTRLYPSRIAGRKKPSWSYELPHVIYRIYEETHSALCNEELILAGIGIRAVVEAVCTHRGLTSGNLKSKIDELKDLGTVTADGAKILHGLRFMGNAAAHETKAHTPSELGTAFEVVENILFNALVLPLRAAKLPNK